MADLFDLERVLDSAKHKSKKRLAKSKSLGQLNGQGESSNRLIALQQSLHPQKNFVRAYEKDEPTIFEQYYVLACGLARGKKVAYTKDDEFDHFTPDFNPRELMRTRMIYLLKIYWNSFNPDAKADKLPSYNMVAHDLWTAFEDVEARKSNGIKKLFYKEDLAEQIKIWEIFLGESREKLFFPRDKSDESAETVKLLKADLKMLREGAAKRNPKKDILITPTFKSKDKTFKDYETFANTIKQDELKDFAMEVFTKIQPDSLSYAYLEWYEDEGDPIFSDEAKKLYNTLSSVVSKSTLTAPKYKQGDRKGSPKDYSEVLADFFTTFKKIVDPAQKQKIKRPPNEQNINNWTSDQNMAIAEAVFKLQASLSSFYYLLKSGEEINIDQLKALSIELTSKADIAETGLDLLAIINASYDTFNGAVISNLSTVEGGGVANFVTDSAWANTAFAPALVTLGGTIHKVMTTDWQELSLQSVTSKALVMYLKTAKTGTQAAMFIKTGNEAWGIKPVMEGAKVSLEVAGAVTGGIGVVLNVHETYKQVKEMRKLRDISKRFKSLITEHGDVGQYLQVKFHKYIQRHRIENKDYKAFDVILQKMHHRRSYSAVGAAGAVAGIGASAIAIAIGVATVANIWNPLGWVLAITSMVAGLGLLTVKGVRKGIKMWRLSKLKENAKDVPKFCKTTGDYWRYKAALLIYLSAVAAKDVETLKRYPKNVGLKIAVGRAFTYILFADEKKHGKEAYKIALESVSDMGIPGIMEFIKG